MKSKGEINAADLASVLTFFGCPFFAGIAAVEKARWFTPIFVVGGLALGYAFAWVVHKTAYMLLNAGCRHSNALTGCVLLVAYVSIPMMLTIGAVAITVKLTMWSVGIIF